MLQLVKTRKERIYFILKNEKDVPNSFDSAEVERKIEEFDVKNAKHERNVKIVSRVFSAIFGVSLLAFVIFLCIRIYQSDYKALNGLFITPGFGENYSVSEEIFTHDTESAFMTSNEGSVFPYSLFYIPKAGYLQISVRYNKNQIESVKRQCPNFTEDKISFSLTDSKGNVFVPKIIATEEKFNYKYFKLEFDGIDFTLDSLNIVMTLNDVEWVKETDTAPAYLQDKVGSKYVAGNLCIHETYRIEMVDDVETKVERQYLPYTLNENEKSQLENLK